MPIVTTTSLDAVNLNMVDGYASFSDTTFTLGLDLDNEGGSGPYKHSPGNGILKISGGSVHLTKSVVNSAWKSETGIVLDINSEHAVIGYLAATELSAEDTSKIDAEKFVNLFPFFANFTVENGDFKHVLSANKKIETAVNTTNGLINHVGDTITPAVGDMISKISKLTDDSSTCTISSSFWYLVE